MFKRLGIIGCGLMGCSFALAAKKAGIVERIVGYSKSPTTTQQALAAGILDEVAPSAMQAVSGSDIVLIAVPVGAMSKIFADIVPLVTSDMLIMDVGSTKQNVVVAAQDNLGKKVSCFVPAHPIAGKAASGLQDAEASMFEGHKVILTPLENTRQEQLDNAVKVWKALGAVVELTSPKDHDASMAAISHLPHLLAGVYMNGVLDQQDGSHYLSQAGSGFRDFTRIAGGEAVMWRDIFMANKIEIQYQLNEFKMALTRMETALANGDGERVLSSVRRASKARNAWSLGQEAAADSRLDEINENSPTDSDPVPATEEVDAKPGFLSRLRLAFKDKSSKN